MRNKTGALLLTALFCATVIVLGKYALQDIFMLHSTTDFQQINGRYAKVAETSLGDVKAHDYHSFSSVQGIVKQLGNYFAAGTEFGDVILFDLYGKMQWKKNLGIGKIKAIEFDPNGKWIFVGEESLRGIFMLYPSWTAVFTGSILCRAYLAAILHIRNIPR